ncbi:magnesium-translocating P-type ATPase [Candidatus Saccharibacteria bacterium]|nr:magnesium-translocating P-type ATPase [Candidatus Saccharibacteria bacterium]
MILSYRRRKNGIPLSEQKGQKRYEEKIRQLASIGQGELYSRLETSEKGISDSQAAEKLDEFGKNIITAGHKSTTFSRLVDAIVNPFNAVLIAVAIVSYITDRISGSKPDLFAIGIILGLVLLASVVAFVQSQRSNTAAEKLSKMIMNNADVIRGGEDKVTLMEDIVVGDMIKLSAGDMIPADVRFVTTKDAFIAQAALTGESNPVEKFSSNDHQPKDSLTDLKNIGFMGTNVISGSATAIVLATGNRTYFGTMAKSLGVNPNKTSFEKGVRQISMLLIRMTLVMIPVVFLINVVTKGDIPQSLLFAIAIAVGLTPEMLPVIMTSTLAKGAVTMSKKKVIVKSLGAIQTFGEMDVLCTDKTGTLTEDKIILEKYMDLRGEDDMHILKYAYLNSQFQTGLKNLLDVAIINRAKANGLEKVLKEHEMVDEIPFDFTRRRMSVVLDGVDGERRLITKGAVEEIMSVSTKVKVGNKIRPMTERDREAAMEVYNRHSRNGLRMVAIAEKKELIKSNHTFTIKDESDLVLIGFVGFLDPPKRSARTAIEALQKHGVRTVVLTGDSEGVAARVCEKVGVNAARILTGKDVDAMNHNQLKQEINNCEIFAKLSPAQKERVVAAFQAAGHTVGYMGDGINDALPLNRADVGISVDSAVDIAKETAAIILLRKDLMVLEEGVIEGRRTFGNIVKYIKMAVSGNFGNMVSVVVASIFLPFLPMLPMHILTQNLLNDFAQMGMPFDNVDAEYIERPRKWGTESIRNFMWFMGPLSSIFDVLCFAIMWWVIGANTLETASLFQAGWFVFGAVSQIVVIYMIRTAKLPFVHSRPSLPLIFSTVVVALVAMLIGFSEMAQGFAMTELPLRFIPWLFGLLILYMLSTQIVKRIYTKKFTEWL